MTKRIFFFFLLTGVLFFNAGAQQLILNSGHSDEVNDVAISPDGKYALSGSHDKTIKLWNIATGKEIRTFIGHTEPVEAVAFSPDGKYVLSGGGTIVRSEMFLWDIATGKKVRSYPNHSMTVYDVAFSPDGNKILSASADQTVKLWDTNTGKVLETFEGHEGWVFTVAFSPDGRFAASGGNEANTIIVWDIEKGKRVKSFKEKSINSVSLDFSPSGNHIISGSIIYDASKGKELTILGGQPKVSRTVAYSPDGSKILSSFFENSFQLWDAETGKKIREFNGHTEEVRSVVFTKDGNYVLSGSKDKTLKLWNVSSGKEIRTFTGQSPNANSFTFAGRYALRNAVTQGSRLADFIKNCTSGNWHCISPDGKSLLTTDKNDAVLKRVPTNEIIQTFSGHSSQVTCVDFTPDGQYIVTGSEDKTIKLWDIKSGNELKTFTGHWHFIYDIAVSNDGKYAASASHDNMVKLWDLSKGKEIKTFNKHDSFVFSIAFGTDSKTLLSGSWDKTAILWDIATGNILKTFVGHKQGINTIAVSPNNKYVLTGTDENIVKLWDLESGNEIHTFSGHSHGIRSVEFSPDSKYFISSSKDGIFKLWSIETKKCLITYWAKSKDVWACYTPEGLFDGSPEGIKLFHFVKGMDILPLDNLFEKYFTPGLMGIVSGTGKQKKAAIEINELKPAPGVKILSPGDGIKVPDKTITIEIEAKGKGGGIDEIRLFQNNKLVQATQRGFKKISKEEEAVVKSFSLQLVNGKNIFRATAFNNERTEAIADEIIVYFEGQKPKSNLHIMAVGVNQYKNQKYNLNYAVKDAQGFVEQIKTGSGDIFGEVKTYFIQDDEALKLSIMNKLKEVKTRAKQEDVVVFYFAGHGVMSEGSSVTSPEFFLIPHDVTQLYGNDEMLNEKAISAKELMELSKEIKAQKQLFVFDACQSGGAMQAFAMRGAAEEKAMAQLARSAGIVVLSASSTEQFATEFNDLGHGTFTYALIEGLQCQADGGTKDRKITVNELKAWIEDRVPELTEKYKGTAQYPTGYSRGQDFPIVICK